MSLKKTVTGALAATPLLFTIAFSSNAKVSETVKIGESFEVGRFIYNQLKKIQIKKKGWSKTNLCAPSDAILEKILLKSKASNTQNSSLYIKGNNIVSQFDDIAVEMPLSPQSLVSSLDPWIINAHSVAYKLQKQLDKIYAQDRDEKWLEYIAICLVFRLDRIYSSCGKTVRCSTRDAAIIIKKHLKEIVKLLKTSRKYKLLGNTRNRNTPCPRNKLTTKKQNHSPKKATGRRNFILRLLLQGINN